MSKSYDLTDEQLIRRLYYLLCQPVVTDAELDEVAQHIEPCDSCGERFEELDDEKTCGSCRGLDA